MNSEVEPAPVIISAPIVELAQNYAYLSFEVGTTLNIKVHTVQSSFILIMECVFSADI